MNNVKQHSRLLDLSNEILARIVELVIGGQVLHVRLKRDPDHGLYCWLGKKCWLSRAQGFYLTPCEAQVSEQQAWEDFQSIHHPHSVPQGDSGKYHVPAPHTRHLTCGSHHGLDCTDHATPSPFSLFYVCSQLTREAVRIFWTTNTFSIRSWPTFTVFLKSISEKSKAAIRTIDLDVDFHYEVTDPFKPDDSFYNEQVDLIDPRDLRSVSGLDSLNLSICGTMMTKLGCRRMHWRRYHKLHKCFVRDVLRLEALNISQLRVIVYDDDENEDLCVYDDVVDRVSGDVWPFRRLTRKEKQEIAKVIHETLKSEKRQVLVQRDLQIRETENLLRDLKAAQERDREAQGLEIQEQVRISSGGGYSFISR
ncbi:MAG: hypothetical protein LQ339_002679 [Xanthoria mediterranea]|nr:MAG: hypothetical protein LQ339_002679 [Xanthoria mediterranea]